MSGHALEIESRPVSRHDYLQIKLAPGGGQAIRIATDLGRIQPRSAPKPKSKPPTKPQARPEPEFDVEKP